MPSNKGLAEANRAKKDEFYTQLADIEVEIKHYRKHFLGKTVLCNCDDPFESNFFKYFAVNFNFLGIKKLIANQPCQFQKAVKNYTAKTLFSIAGRYYKSKKTPDTAHCPSGVFIYLVTKNRICISKSATHLPFQQQITRKSKLSVILL